jgi:hypothetical protein
MRGTMNQVSDGTYRTHLKVEGSLNSRKCSNDASLETNLILLRRIQRNASNTLANNLVVD